MTRRHFVLLLSVVTFSTSSPPPADAQPDCQITAEGRICQVQQPIRRGDLVPVDLQRQLGLVTVDGGCSGTLLNRFWVLTARHCVQVNPQANEFSALLRADRVSITAAWAPGRTGVPSRFVELGGATRRDIILLYLGRADLGDVNTQRLYMTRRGLAGWVGVRLQTTDTVTQYGQGLGTFATGGVGAAPVVLGTGGGVYRSGQFTPSDISATFYTLAMNGANQVGHGGDSGGPSVVTRNGVGVGIAGVQSTCRPTGYAPGAPMTPPWEWATGISFCRYVSVEPIVQEIRRVISETPLCSPHPACLMTPIIEYVLKR